MTALSEIVFGSRKSQLALWQTNAVAQAIVAKNPHLSCRIVQMDTAGDRNIDQPLPEIGGKGLFTAELDAAIKKGDIDIAVHSLKDLPTESSEVVDVIPVLTREDPSDILVSRSSQTLKELPPGSVVGTSSPRRCSQLLAIRSDLIVQSIRGNVPTRVRKVMEQNYDAAVLAFAGVKRVELEEHISEKFVAKEMLPAPGQGSVAATIASNRTDLHSIIQSIVDPESAKCVECERMLLTNLGGGCSAPISALATIQENGQIHLMARVGNVDGTQQITRTASGHDSEQVAQQVAAEILSAGGEEILKQSVSS